MTYVDTNVVLDVLERNEAWFDWSVDALEDARLRGQLVTGPVVAAEVGHYAASAASLGRDFAMLMIDLVDADLDAAWRGGQAFRQYRGRGGRRASLLPDFLIGGHAAALGAAVLTRDARRFRSYFPELALITPETDHG